MKAKRPFKVNKFIFLVIFFAIGVLSMGASSWLIINEQSGSPEFKVQNLELNCEVSEVLSPIYYGANEQPKVTDKAVVKYGNETVAGSWVVPNVSLKETSCSANVVNNVSGSEIVICNEDNTVEVVFTAKDTKYGKLTVKVPVPIKPVVYKGDNSQQNAINSPEIYYSNIEKALESGSDGSADKFFVISDLKQTNNPSALFTPTISKNCTIKQKNVLSLRIGEIIENQNDASATAEPECTVSDTSATRNKTFREMSTATQTFADSGNDSAKYLKTNVIINDGITLTVSSGATLFVAGSAGTSSAGISGFTSRNYSQITLGTNATIDNKGVIDCLGFIKEKSWIGDTKTNNSKIINNGDIYNPFVVYDYRGGTSTVGAYLDGKLGLGDLLKLLNGGEINITPGPQAVFPFNTFDCPNIQVETETFYGHNVYGYTDLYTNELNKAGITIPAQHNMTIVTIIGKSGNNPIIELGSDSSSIKVKYAPKSVQNTITKGQPTQARQEDGITTLNIYGNATLGSVSLTISVLKATVNISSNSVFFPITWKHNVILNDADNNPSNGNSTFNINVPTKFMSGASLTINRGATLNISDEVIFYNRSVTYNHNTYQTDDSPDVFCDKVAYTQAGYNYQSGYPTPGCNYPGKKEEAKCIVNGSLNVTSTGKIGGKVLSETAGASLVLANVNSVTSLDGWGTFDAGTSGASGDFIESDTTTRQPIGDICNTDLTDLGVATYYSIESSTGVYEWLGKGVSIDVEYVLDINNLVTGENHSNVTTFDFSSSISLSKATSDSETYKFTGWFFDLSNVNTLVDELSIETVKDYVINGKVIIYAKWEEVEMFNIEFITTDSTFNSNNGITVSKRERAEGTNYNPYNDLKSAITQNDDMTSDVNKKYYFGGWYYDSALTDKVPETGFTVSKNETLYVKWIEKTKITFTTTNGATVNIASPITGAKGTYYAKSGETIIFTVADGDGISSVKAGNVTLGTAEGQYTYTVPETDVTITVEGKSGCLVEGTLITLADGTQKAVEDLTLSDEVLVFNHETGAIEKGNIAMLDHLDFEREWHNVINLKFSNGNVLRTVWNHGLYNVTLNRYVFIHEGNYKDYIGDEFYSIKYVNGEFVNEIVKLTESYITNEFIKVYNPTTAIHMNYFASGMLNVTALPNEYLDCWHVNIFEYDENMKIDEEKKQADIEKYGLYTYEDFKEYLTEEQFNVLPFNYLKVAVGKGRLTWEDIIELIEYFKINNLI